MANAVIVDAVRTPLGKRGGALKDVRPDDLAAHVLRAITERTGIKPALVEDVILGCVTQTEEQGTNIARIAALVAGFPETVPGTSVNRQCGSGQQAVNFGAMEVLTGTSDVVIAGGVESMTRVPMGSDMGALNEKEEDLGLKPRARIVAMAQVGVDPVLMLEGPIPASKKVLKKADLDLDDIALWEINEAFASIPLMTIKTLGIDPGRVNVNGGAIALGHPLGATGARLMTTLLNELEKRKARYGLSTLCIGFGQGIATVIERLG